MYESEINTRLLSLIKLSKTRVSVMGTSPGYGSWITELGVQRKQQGGCIIHLASNAYHLTVKNDIVKLCHVAAG